MKMMDMMDSKKEDEEKLTTMEDVSRELSEDFEDEIEDCKKYHCMAKIAENAGCEEECYYLLEMSKDEYTHALFIHTYMHDHNMHVPEELETEFDALTEKMEEFFR